MLDDNDTVPLAYRSHDLTLLVLTWTIRNTTSHLELLSTHLVIRLHVDLYCVLYLLYHRWI